jgi:hypothetical protein
MTRGNGTAALWTQRLPRHSPDPRADAVMVYDSDRHVSVLFGGDVFFEGDSYQTNLNETWEWDGTDWTDKTPASNSPQARWHHSMVYDPTHTQTMLVGGLRNLPADGGGDLLVDADDGTWGWDGSHWAQLTAEEPTCTNYAGTPSLRGKCPLTFDENTGSVISSGHQSSKWTGASWQPLPAIPTEVYNGSSVFDLNRGLIYVGTRNSGSFHEVWLWDGQSWTQSPAMAPFPSAIDPLAYDSREGVTINFGFGRLDGSVGQTWEFR